MAPKIWIINQFGNTPDVPGHTRQYDLGKSLSQQNCSVKVFSSDYNLTKREYLKLRPLQVWNREEFDDLEWYWLYATPYKSNDWKRYLNMLSFCFTLFFFCLFQPKPDLIIGSSPQILSAFVAWILSRIKGAKFYFEVRDLWPQTLIDLGGKSPDSLLVKFLAKIESWLYRHSDHVIIVAQGWLDYVRDRGANQVIWLPNGPNLDDFSVQISQQEARSKYAIPQELFCVIYTGAHGDANGLSAVVEAARILDKDRPNTFKIFLVGDGPEKENLMKQGNNISSLEFRDSIPKSEIPYLLKAADALIITLKNAAVFRHGVSPNKLYDYYAASKPVIVGIEGTAIKREVEEHQVGFVTKPEDPHEIAESIIKLSSMSDSERDEMGRRAKSLATNTYSRNIVVNNLWNLIRAEL